MGAYLRADGVAMKPLAGIPVPDRLVADEANLRSAFRPDEPSSTRLIDADETVNRLRPHFSRLGIVRMAEVTGLAEGRPRASIGRTSRFRCACRLVPFWAPAPACA